MRHAWRGGFVQVGIVAGLAVAWIGGEALSAERAGAAPRTAGAGKAPMGAAVSEVDPVLGALSEQPLMVLRVDSLTGLSEALARTRIGQHAEASPLLSSWFDLCRDVGRVGAALLTDFPAATLRRILSRQAALAVFQVPAGAVRPECVALAVDLGEDARTVQEAFRQQVVPRLEASNPRLTVSETTLDGVPVTLLKDGPKESYVRFAGELLLLGTREAVLKFRPAASVAQWLPAARGRAGVAWAYLNLQPLWDQAMRRLAQSPQELQGLEGSGLPALKAIRGTTAVEEGGFRDSIVAQVDADAGGFLPAAMGVKAGDARCAAVVPADYAFLASFQIESGERFYRLIEEVIRQTQGEVGLQQFRGGMGQIDQVFAINVEWELLPRIGREFFFAARVPDEDLLAAGQPPQRPDFGPFFGFAVNDVAAMGELFERFAASPQAAQMGWQLYTEGHEGKEVRTLRNIAAPAALSFAFLGDYLVCSQDAQTVRSVVSAFVAGKTMANDPQYEATRKRLPAAANAYAYVDTRPLRPLLAVAVRAKTPPRAQAWLPVIERAVPDLGGYGLALVAEGTELRAEGYGDVPAAFSLFSLASLGIAVESQKQAAVPRAVPAAGAPPF